MAQLKSEVIGHKRLFDQWTQLLQRKQLTGSFLFVGPSGVGKKKSAWAFIQQVLCEKPIQFQACGECGPCRRVQLYQHESVLFIEPDGALIKVEQAQNILQFLQLRSLTSHRFVLIDEAQKMNASTANSLLKTLEEPSENTTLILLAPSLTSVLPTIRSRLRVFHFQPVPLEDMKQSHHFPDWVLEASLGRFDLLEVLNSPSEKQFRMSWADHFVKFLISPDVLTDDSWRDAIKNKEDLKQGLDLWLKMIRDSLFLQQGENKSLLTRDLSEQLQKIAALSSEELQFVGQSLVNLQKEMSFNKDPLLSLESLYISLKA